MVTHLRLSMLTVLAPAFSLVATSAGTTRLADPATAASSTARAAPPGSIGRTDPTSAFGPFADEYFDSLFASHPARGTAAGFHQYDSRLQDYSAAAYQRRIATLNAQLARLESIRKQALSRDDSIDAAILDGAIRSELLEDGTLETWRTNPIPYVGQPGRAINLLISRNFAPPAERLRSAVARLRAIPAVLVAMRTNVTNPPVEFTDLAIRVSGGSVGFYKNSVAAWARDAVAGDSALLREFTVANDSVVAAMQSARDWLTNDLKPRSHGQFAIGAKNFADLLRYQEMVDLPLDKLLAIGEANLAKDRADFIATAAKVAPGKTPQEAMAVLEADHPSAATLIPTANSTVAGARRFLVDHGIVDIPSDVMPTVAETPPFARSGTFASMDSPGAYETKATEAFYYVTPPEASWDAQHVEQHLRFYNRPVLDIVTVHEVFPGHYLQFLYATQFPTKTRKLVDAGTNVEGWAHYGEQMMVEQGFGNGDPKIKLAQLSAALQRDCRYVVGIKEHTQGLSVADGGSRYFVDQCFMQPANAYEEARRGAYNPTYLYYTLGKLQIYKLRADYQRAKGKDFSLREFHDQFVRQGGVPIAIMRRILLPGDGSPTL